MRHIEEFGKCPHVRTCIDAEGVPFCLDCQTRQCAGVCETKCWVVAAGRNEIVVDT